MSGTISLQKSNQLKSIAILMMLFLHIFNRDYSGLFEPLIFMGQNPLSYYISLFCDACVPIFAFVSGYGLYYKYSQNHSTFKKDNVNRLKKLYINYWIIIILFAVLLGYLLAEPGYPGSLTKFILNFSGLDPSYNGAWWFFTTYVFFVLTSSFWFGLLHRINPWIYLFAFLIIYLIAFYFRIYQSSISDNSFLNYLHKQSALYFCTLFQFMLGAFALKYKWHQKVSLLFSKIKGRNFIACVIIGLAVIFHGIIPNFVVAPFTALVFIFMFLQLKLSQYINRTLDYFAPHATNLWLIHMFFYLIYFKDFVYGFKYVPIIFVVLIGLCLVSSYLVNFVNRFIQKRV